MAFRFHLNRVEAAYKPQAVHGMKRCHHFTVNEQALQHPKTRKKGTANHCTPSIPYSLEKCMQLLRCSVRLFLRTAAMRSISPCWIVSSRAATILSLRPRKFSPVRFAATVL